MEKLPSVQKVYEAWSAIADGRTEMGDGTGHVVSSDGAKRYDLSWDGDVFSSNDNATWWQGYAGYPVLALLMEQGRLPFDETLAARFAGIDWHALNARHKRDYAAAAEEAFDEAGLTSKERAQAEALAARTIEELRALPLVLKRKGRPAKAQTPTTEGPR